MPWALIVGGANDEWRWEAGGILHAHYRVHDMQKKYWKSRIVAERNNNNDNN